MAFELTGLIGEEKASIRWDGHSYAQKWLMDVYREYLKINKGRFLGFPPGDGATENYDKVAPAAYAAWLSVFDTITERSGEFPWEELEVGRVY